ncbi:MAG: hypothetical protein HPY50_18295 [Firmicutes bacterium]|nr:hypothetical protein [Bacillota bacterium]
MGIEKPQSDLEVIELRVESQPSRYFSGFGGSFATLLDSCQRKKNLPGLYEDGLLAKVELDGRVLELTLSGGRTVEEIDRIMDMAFENISTFLCPGGDPGYLVVVRCESR